MDIVVAGKRMQQFFFTLKLCSAPILGLETSECWQMFCVRKLHDSAGWEFSVGWVYPRVGLGRAYGSEISVFSGLGSDMGLKWQVCEKMQVVHICVSIFESSIDGQIRFEDWCMILMAGQLSFDVWGFCWVWVGLGIRSELFVLSAWKLSSVCSICETDLFLASTRRVGETSKNRHWTGRPRVGQNARRECCSSIMKPDMLWMRRAGSPGYLPAPSPNPRRIN